MYFLDSEQTSWFASTSSSNNSHHQREARGNVFWWSVSPPHHTSFLELKRLLMMILVQFAPHLAPAAAPTTPFRTATVWEDWTFGCCCNRKRTVCGTIVRPRRCVYGTSNLSFSCFIVPFLCSADWIILKSDRHCLKWSASSGWRHDALSISPSFLGQIPGSNSWQLHQPSSY